MSKASGAAALKERATGVPTEVDQVVAFPKMLEQFKGEIAKALPRHLHPDRMARIALTAFRRTPKLAKCDPRSVFAAVIQASQLGLEPDTLGRSYLIPYGRECQFIPGWKGLVDLVNRAGTATVWTGAVFQGDEFDYALGDRPFVMHRPSGEDDPALLTHAYAVGRVKGAEWPVIEVWPIARVFRHRDRYNRVGRDHYSFKHPEMYARKVVLLQVLKYMPCSADMSAAIALNDAAEVGAQNLTVKDAIEGTWAPVPEEDGAAPPAPEPAQHAQTQVDTSAAPAASAEPTQSDAQPEVGVERTTEDLDKYAIKPGKRAEPIVTHAEISERMARAKTAEALDEAASLIDLVASEEQRQELKSLYEQCRATLGEGKGGRF